MEKAMSRKQIKKALKGKQVKEKTEAPASKTLPKE
jgi:hypothetical protein